MSSAGKIADLEGILRARGAEVIRERFRLPSRPRISPCSGFLACASAAFLLAAGVAAASFPLGIAGATLLLLDAGGFSPLAWLGPKEARTVLVVPGTPSDGKGRALFFGIPLRSRLTPAGYFSRREELLRAVSAGGMALAFLLCVASAGALLLLLPPLPVAGGAAGIALLALAAWEGVRPAAPAGPENEAAGWVDRLAFPPDAPFRPYLLVYSGDPAEVAYFLARHRGPLLRGRGAILDFARGAEGPPAASVREGPIFPCRVAPPLLSLVREAGKRRGVPPPREIALREKSAGMLAMARGFSAITLFRFPSALPADPPFSAEAAAGWALEIAASAGPQEQERS